MKKQFEKFFNYSNSLIYPLKKTIRWAIKSTEYAKILWKDFDWDFTYILILLQYKLKRTRLAILKDNIILRNEEVASQIEHVETLISKYLDNDFCKELYDAHDKKWGTRVKNEDASEPSNAPWDWPFRRENATTIKLHRQEKEEYMAIHELAEKERQKVFENIFDFMKKYMQQWWD